MKKGKMEKKRTRGPQIKDTAVEVLIAEVHQKHPKWKAPKVRNEVSLVLRKNNSKLPTSWPSLSAVQKVLAIVRRKIKEHPILPQDKPWSTAMLNKASPNNEDNYPIPPEALPMVLKVWKSRIEKGEGFTIREAKWTARFSFLEKDIEKLYFLASRHARTELMFELVGHPFDSTGLDMLVMGMPMSISKDIASAIPLLAEQREDKERGIKDGVEQIKDDIAEKKVGKGEKADNAKKEGNNATKR